MGRERGVIVDLGLINYIIHNIVEVVNILITIVALIIIIKGTVLSIMSLFMEMRKTPGIYIGESLDLGLRYLMVSEVLHTFTSESLSSLINLAILLAIRVAIVVFNQKEMEHELQIIEELEEIVDDIE